MCRHLAYLGPPVTLASLLYDPPHALVRQASSPRDMRGGGTINADGFGLGWFAGPDAAPLRYRRAQPIWADVDLPALAAEISAPAAVAAVRSATPGMPVTEAACAPFAGDGWLFSLNGRIAGWPEAAASLGSQLPVAQLLTMPAPTDSALLWTLLRLRLAAGEPAPAAVAGLVCDVLAAAPSSRLNLLLADSHTIIATTVTHALSVRSRPGSVLISSEPLDEDPAWSAVPDYQLVVASMSGVDIQRLPGRPTEGKP